MVRCGDWDRQIETSSDEFLNYQDRTISSVSIHPKYSGSSGIANEALHNDIAILFVQNDFKLDQHIDTICLPEFPNQRNGQYNNNNCVAMGWGADTFKSEEYKNKLSQIQLPIVDNQECQRLLRRTKLRNQFNLHDNFLCAGGDEQNTCNGDGGSSLVCPSIDNPKR